jgi:ABC-type multidrug transport system fused ATPase/permease subunit
MVIYMVALILDSFVQIVFAMSVIPLVDILSSGFDGNNRDIIELIKNIFSFIGIEYTLLSSMGFFIFIVILSAITETLLYFIGRKNVYRISYYFMSEGLSRFFKKGLKFINSQTFGTIQNTFQKEVEKITNGVDSVLIATSGFIQVFFLLLLAFSLSSLMTVIAVVSILVLFFLLSDLNQYLKELSNITVASGNDLSKALFEPLLNSKQVLSSGRSQTVFDNYAVKFNIHSNDAVRSQTLSFSIPLIFRIVSIISTLIALYVAISYGDDPVILIAALFALIRITPVVSKISAAFSAINVSIPSLNQFENIFGYFNEEVNSQPKEKYNNFSTSIVLKDIEYHHAVDRESVVDINIEIEKNSHVSFVGPSGSGKTTTVDILIGLLSPIGGSVFIDQKPLREIELNSFLQCVGYVQQTPFLFNGTVKDNLLWSNPSATEEEMWDALKTANIESFVRNNVEQLNLLVGDRGVSLSGGQKQRIVLAQALVRNPDILVLDEATSSLDQESEYLIIEALKKIAHKTTIISITHKPIMTKNSDTIFVFDNGRIVESGTYSELISDSFSRLNNMV